MPPWSTAPASRSGNWPCHPHRGSESAAQLITADRPLWRADLFDRLGSTPGRFDAAHYHPRFNGNEPCDRHWDRALTAAPWDWLADQISSLGAAPRGDGWSSIPATPRNCPAWPPRS